MKINPKISVITVVYNGADKLEQTILSVINQTYRNIEYIIIDGGSVDGTTDIIKKYESKIAYWISEPDKGIYDAMNKGIDKSTGDWINFMNCGDCFHNMGIINDVFCANDLEFDIIFGQVNGWKNRKGKVTGFYLYMYLGICHQTIFAQRQSLRDGFSLKYEIAADFEWLLRSYYKGFKISSIDRIIVDYEGGGISSINYNKLYHELCQILKQYYPIIISYPRCSLWFFMSYLKRKMR